MSDMQKQLKIKTGVVKRLVKEHAYYIKETAKQGEKIEKMKADASIDPYDIKKAGEVLQDSRQMIGDTARRVAAAVDDLKNMLSTAGLTEEVQEVVDAREQLAAGEAVPV